MVSLQLSVPVVELRLDEQIIISIVELIKLILHLIQVEAKLGWFTVL